MDRFEHDLVGLQPKLRSYAQSLCGNPQECDDLVQEALVRAWGARSSFTDGTKLSAWVMVIMRNYFLSQQRRRRFTDTASLDDTDHPVRVPGVSGGQEASVDLNRTLEVMQTLPQGMQEALNCIGVEEFTYQETAVILSVNLGTVKSRLFRARKLLQERLNQGCVPMPNMIQ